MASRLGLQEVGIISTSLGIGNPSVNVYAKTSHKLLFHLVHSFKILLHISFVEWYEKVKVVENNNTSIL
jgi:hypothetical protein